MQKKNHKNRGWLKFWNSIAWEQNFQQHNQIFKKISGGENLIKIYIFKILIYNGA